MTDPQATDLNDAHCHFFSAGFFATLGRRSASSARVGSTWSSHRARGSMGGGTRPSRRDARRHHGERPG